MHFLKKNVKIEPKNEGKLPLFEWILPKKVKNDQTSNQFFSKVYKSWASPLKGWKLQDKRKKTLGLDFYLSPSSLRYLTSKLGVDEPGWDFRQNGIFLMKFLKIRENELTSNQFFSKVYKSWALPLKDWKLQDKC